MAAMASKFYYVCAIQYYPDQCSGCCSLNLLHVGQFSTMVLIWALNPGNQTDILARSRHLLIPWSPLVADTIGLRVCRCILDGMTNLVPFNSNPSTKVNSVQHNFGLDAGRALITETYAFISLSSIVGWIVPFGIFLDRVSAV